MMRRILVAPVAGVLICLVLAGCTDPGASACDNANRDITLGNLAGNSMSGSYAACVNDLKSELQGLRLQSRSLQAEAARLNAAAASMDGERRAAAQRLARLNAEQARLMQEISTARSDASSPRVRQVLAEEQRLRRDIQAQGQGADPDVAQRLSERQMALNRLARETL